MTHPSQPEAGLTLDLVVNVLSQTLFSAFFCAFVPVAIAGHAKSWHQPAVYWSAGWAAFLVILAALKYMNRLYAARGSYFFLPPRLNWEEQIVLITGGGSGIGALLVETLALRNVTVVILDLALPKEPIENDNVYSYICDVSDYKQVQACAEKIRSEVGDPTILVNNAGTVRGKLLLDLTEEDIRTTFGANTLAHFWTLKAFLPAMLEKGTGHIVNVASLMGMIGSDYCASKAALISLHQSLRFELDNRYLTPQIRTTLLIPSFLSTPLFARAHMPHSATSLGAFACPPVSPPTIVKALIAALDADEGRVIRLPFYSQMARVWGVGPGLMPKWLMDIVQWLSGADWAMRDLGSRPDAGELLEARRRERAAGLGDKDRQ
ncbi:uncharacterized protein MKK02DRAFT_40631 [Dioszegia hungarica]|uniref:Ketoreductase domain-containing protein n=1 Tax=Dioszegia hungarica TaxID=4972 RepID=A0AA38H0F1_9TREE|nr:uncharacterized protein MKK02DRAFT_40631 [Dioszegia hungarica]KAI9632328.1 hypothetical protein MKK02DRAFT_40631 [Dioszegia hungarica]